MIQKLKAAIRGLVAVVLMLFATNFLPVAAAYAGTNNNNSSDNDKVFVCKYVGTPHVDERLQTGQNPISVSTHSIQNNEWNGQVPGWFSDAHDRSYVLAYDTGQPEPDVSACPTPEGPTEIAPPTLHTDVVCGPNNDVTTLTDSADKDHYTVSHQGNTYTVTAKSGYTFASDDVVTLTVPVDANTACPDVVITPPTLHTDVVCGPNNDDTTLVDSADKDHYTVSHQGNTYTVTAKSGYTFGTGKTVELTEPTDANTKCPPTKVFVCKYVGTPGVDERLQTGQNPISVSINAIKDFNGVGSYFNDAQGRSYVLAYDTGQAEPDASECPQTENKVTPVVHFTEPTCEHTTGSVTVTTMDGVTYKVNGATISGTTSYPAGSAVTVTAVLASGYILDTGAQSSFSHTFKAAPTDCTLGDTDVCPNITGDQATVPAGMTKDNSGNCVTPPGGQGGDEGVVLSASTTATPQLANTGENSLASIITGLVAIVMAVGLTLASRKQLSR